MSLLARITALEREIAADRAELAAMKHIDHSHPTPRGGAHPGGLRRGDDYAWGRPRPSLIVRSGASFVVRYVGAGQEGKDLTRSEAEDLGHSRLDLVCCYESTAERAAEGFAAGAADIRTALTHAHACGMPHGRPVYLTADFNAQGAQLDAVAEYVRGGVHASSFSEVGIYGGLHTIEHLRALNRCRYFWQTIAWSGTPTVWSPHAQLQQRSVTAIIDGVSCDLDLAVALDFGQWRP